MLNYPQVSALPQESKVTPCVTVTQIKMAIGFNSITGEYKKREKGSIEGADREKPPGSLCQDPIKIAVWGIKG